MTITAQSAEQIVQLLRKKVEAGTLDKETAERLAVLALQEVQVADDVSEGADTSDEGQGEEEMSDEGGGDEPAPADPTPTAVDPSAQILALVNQFDQGTASLWTSVKAKIEDVLKGAAGASFPLGSFSNSAKTGAKGNTTSISIDKGDNGSSVDVSFRFTREWNVPGITPPETVAAKTSDEPTCHLGLRKELLSLAQDLTDMTDSELTWKRCRFPEKTIAFISSESAKAGDPRVVEAVKALPESQDRHEWRKWSLTAQVYVLGTDYSNTKTFADLAKEIKE